MARERSFYSCHDSSMLFLADLGSPLSPICVSASNLYSSLPSAYWHSFIVQFLCSSYKFHCIFQGSYSKGRTFGWMYHYNCVVITCHEQTNKTESSNDWRGITNREGT